MPVIMLLLLSYKCTPHCTVDRMPGAFLPFQPMWCEVLLVKCVDGTQEEEGASLSSSGVLSFLHKPLTVDGFCDTQWSSSSVSFSSNHPGSLAGSSIVSATGFSFELVASPVGGYAGKSLPTQWDSWRYIHDTLHEWISSKFHGQHC